MKSNASSKPPYAVPSMEQIRSMPWNGFNAISTFSGCGGSSTGYRMAGFKILWASEFIDAARESYAANKAPYTILDGRDIRQVQATDILQAINMKPGELDLFDGSPPCASFSTAGKREAGWGKIKKYSDKAQRTDDLFFEFSRLVRGVQPKTFVAENVSGLVKGTAKGYFLEILKELKSCGYRVSCKVLDAQWLGVPQARQRTIFIGVREDFGIDPVHPKPLAYRYSVRDALPWIVRHGTAPPHADYVASGRNNETTMVDSSRNACPTITTSENKGVGHVEAEKPITHFDMGKGFGEVVKVSADSGPYQTVGTGPSSGNGLATSVYSGAEKRKFTIAELKRICAFPDDFILTGSYAQQWERCGRAVPPVMMMHIAATIRDHVLAKVK